MLKYSISTLVFILIGQLNAWTQEAELSEIRIDENTGIPVITSFKVEGVTISRFEQPLQVKMDSTSLRAFPFVGSVGGVSFKAVLDYNGRPKDIEIDYVPQNEDGKRLFVKIGRESYFPLIYDWQLLPISKYADSDFNACVSLFGPETNEDFYNIVYHPAFKNTLLGLRLLQSDIMFIDLGVFWNVFSDGQAPILGKGEAVTNRENWREYAARLNEIFKDVTFRSWVLTDEGEDVLINVENKLELTGNPYYYFWDSDVNKYQQERENLIEKANDLQEEQNVEAYNLLVEKINQMEPQVIPVSVLTSKLKNNRNLLEGYNPLVYNAVTNVMRYSALFRYIKEVNTIEWIKYIGEIRSAENIQTVNTPQIWRKSH